MADVPASAEVPASTEDRLAAYLIGEQPAPRQAIAQPAPTSEEPIDQPADEAGAEVVAPPQDDAEQTEADEPFEELDHLGKTYEVPVSLKKAFEENRAMATKASQTAKQAETLLQHVNAQAQLIQAEAQFAEYAKPEMSERAQLDAVIKQYRNALADPSLDRDLRMDYMGKMEAFKAQLEQVQAKIDEKQGQYKSWRSQQRQQMLNAGQEYLHKVIPSFAQDQTKLSIAQQAAQLGYTQDEISNMEDPRLVHALHKAAQWDRLQATKPQASSKTGKAPPVARPGSNNSANNAAVAQQNALRARLKKSGDYKDAAALLERYVR